MQHATSKWQPLVGWTLGGLLSAFMAFSGIMKFIQPGDMSKEVEKLGWNPSQMPAIGAVELACVVLYLIPRTSVLGAVLLTGYLGGATATHVRLPEPWFLPVLIGVLFWVALGLREPRIWALLPVRRSKHIVP
jgi:DoxX-like family